LLDDKTIAKVHACTGPLFFAVATAITTLLFLDRRAAIRRGDDGVDGRHRDPAAADGAVAGRRMALPAAPTSSVTAGPSWATAGFVPPALAAAAYLQLVAGAQLRHLDPTLTPADFRWLVALHLFGAAAVVVLSALAVLGWQPHEPAAARRWSRVILALVGCQVLLGCTAWLVTYGMPGGWLPDAWSGPLVARSLRSAVVVTGHAVLGMLILGAAVVLMLVWPGITRAQRAARLWREAPV
ncbi:MAG: hypothetical protein EBZ59_13675, partial [Planctomycetia bacterium]|nr:hypothetical protein [Planctomycetia bacterium]